MKNRCLKGQAAIEYLMTYGWAILVIAIVIVALYMMTQTHFTLEQCQFQPGFICNDPLPQVYKDNQDGKIYMSIRVHNKQPRTIIVKKVLCTVSPPSDISPVDAQDLGSGISIPPNTYYTFSSKTGEEVLCKKGSFDLDLAPGQTFRGYFVMWYNYEDDPEQTVMREAKATVSLNVEEK